MYVPINVKTHNTLLFSMIKINDLIKRAKEYNINTLTITDTTMYGVMDFYMECKRNDIKPIIGLELMILEAGIILYARNEKGYKNLVKLSTLSTEGLLEVDDLKSYASDLICIIPFELKESYSIFNDIYEYLFCGYRNIDEKEAWGRGNVIYSNAILCLDKNDLEYLNYLEAIKKGVLLDTINTVYSDNYLMNYDEYKSFYPCDGENNKKIGELCDIKLTFNLDLLPLYECPNNMDAFTYLKELCKKGLKRVFVDKVPSLYIERLKYELDIINKMGFCNYFLVVWDYIKYSKENDILVGPGRGSAAGSLVAYLLDITTVDPLKYNLLFERFLNPERISMPDIDIDFEDRRRDDVVKYCTDKYGLKRVAQIITFGTLGAKQAIRDVARCLDTNLKVVDSLCSMIDSRYTLMDNYKSNKKLQGYINNTSELKKIYKVALKLEGLKRHTSIHAAGVVMCKIDLDEVIPLDKSHERFYVTGYSMEHLEKIGLLKMDFLVLRNLTLIHDVLKDIGNLTFDTIPLNDKKALSIFTNVNTLGIFQFESRGMMNFLCKFKPSSFADVCDAIALFRPGPMGNIDSYVRRKHGEEKIEYIHPSLEKILSPTAGIIIYQEQIMEIAKVMAGYSLGEADVLRRAMSKKKEDVLKAEKDKFVKGSLGRGYDSKTANDVFELILKFASYGFNKAHSVVYAMIAYKMAYLKSHYPHIFMKHLLSMVIGSDSKTKEYIYEAKKMGISVLKPDINKSDRDYKIEGMNIRYPLPCIRSVGNATASLILDERENGTFNDIYDFVGRCYGRSINKKTFEALILSGSFDNLEFNKRTLIENADKLLDYGELAKDLAEYSLKPEITIYDEYDKKVLMNYELELFGFYLSNHPVTEYRIKESGIPLNQIEVNFNKNIKVVGYVDRVTVTKSDKPMSFITLSDETSIIELVLFNKVYSLYDNIKKGDIILANGLVEKRYDKYQINVNNIKKVETSE